MIKLKQKKIIMLSYIRIIGFLTINVTHSEFYDGINYPYIRYNSDSSFYMKSYPFSAYSSDSGGFGLTIVYNKENKIVAKINKYFVQTSYLSKNGDNIITLKPQIGIFDFSEREDIIYSFSLNKHRTEVLLTSDELTRNKEFINFHWYSGVFIGVEGDYVLDFGNDSGLRVDGFGMVKKIKFDSALRSTLMHSGNSSLLDTLGLTQVIKENYQICIKTLPPQAKRIIFHNKSKKQHKLRIFGYLITDSTGYCKNVKLRYELSNGHKLNKRISSRIEEFEKYLLSSFYSTSNYTRKYPYWRYFVSMEIR